MASGPEAAALTLPTGELCRIVFLEPRRAGALLDLLGVADMEPFTVEVALPWSAWAVAAARTLESWAACDSELCVVMELVRGTPRLHLTDGCRSILLDLRP